MAEFIDFDGPELILRFDNSRPIKAATFARVLRDMASDYKRLYRDDLIIVAVSEGSLVAKLKSFSEFAEKSNHILQFGKNLAWLFAAGAVGYSALQGQAHPDERLPLKAVQGLANLAVQSHSRLELKYTESGKEEIIVNITPAEAKKVEGQIKGMTRRRPIPPWSPQLTWSDQNGLPSDPTGLRVDTLKTQLVDLGQRKEGLKSLPPDARKLIVALVLALQQSAPNRVSQLIRELKLEGQYGAAGLVREIIWPASGTGGLLLPTP